MRTLEMARTICWITSWSLLLAAGPALAQNADVTLVCDYVRTEYDGSYAQPFSATYHLSDGSWHATQTMFWKDDVLRFSNGASMPLTEVPIRIEIDRATAGAMLIKGPNSPHPHYQKGQCRKFEGRQF